MNQYDELLKTFTRNPEELLSSKFDWTSSPQSKNGEVFATDGRIAIKMPIRHIESTYPEWQDIFNPLVIFEQDRLPQELKFNTAELLSSLTDKEIAEMDSFESCGDCGGSGICNGCFCESKHQCGECGGGGLSSAPLKYIAFVGSKFRFNYLKMVFAAADLHNQGDFYCVATSSDKPSVFYIGDIEIALMGIKQASEEKTINFSKTANAA